MTYFEKIRDTVTTEVLKTWMPSLLLLMSGLFAGLVPTIRHTLLSLPPSLLLGLLAISLLGNSGTVAYILILRKRARKLKNQFENYPEIPSRTLVPLLKASQAEYWWSLGSQGNTPAMHIHAEFIVTNITEHGVFLTGAKVRKPAFRGYVLTKRIDSDLYDWFAIPAKQTTFAFASIWGSPPFKEKGESFTTSLAIIDQFGNEHWIENLQFIYRGKL